MEIITTGSKVTYYYLDEPKDEFSQSMEGTIIHAPAGPGDLWQFKSNTGAVFAINPYGPTFISFDTPVTK